MLRSCNNSMGSRAAACDGGGEMSDCAVESQLGDWRHRFEFISAWFWYCCARIVSCCDWLFDPGSPLRVLMLKATFIAIRAGALQPMRADLGRGEGER